MFQFAALVGPSALAAKEFTLSPNGENGRYVRVVGRKSGLLSWFLALLGVDATTVLEVRGDRIHFRSSSLSGSLTTTVPLGTVSECSAGYFKPVIYLVLGFLTLPLVITIIGAIVPILFFLAYYLYKTLLITIRSHSGHLIAIAFKRSVIEGIKVEEADALAAVDIISELLVARHDRPEAKPPQAIRPVPPPFQPSCPKCGRKLEPGSVFCDDCGHKLS